MARKFKSWSSWFNGLIIAAGLVAWAYSEIQNHRSGERNHSAAPEPPPVRIGHGRVGGYEVYRNCTLTEARNNDGDSFIVKLPDGKKAEFRLYFVDSPESAFKSYASGDTNHARIRQQAADMGGITPEEAVEIGGKAKNFTLELLRSRPFDLYTRWDSPFKDDRFHAFIEIREDGKARWLEELLIERGLARIKTKPADLPDGTAAPKQLARLRELERTAKRAKVGAWSMK